MKRVWGLLAFALSLYSCNYFETKKVDAETLFQEEMATINWEEVDSYPLFANCDETQPKQQQLQCFHRQLSEKVSEVLGDSIQGVMQNVNDTLYLQMKIDTAGQFTFKELKIDSITRRHLPKMESWLSAALRGIESVAPATKKGVPVATLYTLPIVLTTD